MPAAEHLDAARRERFERAFAEVYGPLQRYVRRRAAPALVDDVVAEALLVLWRRLDSVTPGAELPWAYGAARRCLANSRRGEERRERLATRVAADAAAVAPEPELPDPELAAALAQLPADDREIVRLWAWEELAPREIGVVMGISANAASIRLHRAKRRLATLLGTGKDGPVSGQRTVGDLTGLREEGS